MRTRHRTGHWPLSSVFRRSWPRRRSDGGDGDDDGDLFTLLRSASSCPERTLFSSFSFRRGGGRSRVDEGAKNDEASVASAAAE